MARAAGSWASWAVLGGLGAALALQPLGCGPTDEVPVDESFIAEVLTDVGPEVVEPALADFVEAGDALVAATRAWRDAAPVEREAAKEASRSAFLDAMRAWQRVEGLQIGPLGPALTTVAGEDGRDEIYSWPTVNPCRVDQETVRESWDEPDFFEITLVNARGLDALEHLLFAGPDNVCPGQVDINAEGTWDALGAEGVEANRAALGAATAADVVARARAQQARWGDSFWVELASAGEEGSPYASATEGLNAVYDALFYLETATQDRKLGLPLGLRDCTVDCAQQAEGVPSGDSHVWISANLDGFEALFTGGAGFGVDDLLRERGHGDVADAVIAQLATARTAADALDLPIDEAIATRRDDVVALHEAIKAVNDTLAGDVGTVLSLTLPSEAAGDAD